MEWYMEAVRRQNIEHRPSRHWRDKLQVSEVWAEMTHCCKNDWEILCVDWLWGWKTTGTKAEGKKKCTASVKCAIYLLFLPEIKVNIQSPNQFGCGHKRPNLIIKSCILKKHLHTHAGGISTLPGERIATEMQQRTLCSTPRQDRVDQGTQAQALVLLFPDSWCVHSKPTSIIVSLVFLSSPQRSGDGEVSPDGINFRI